MSNTYQDENGDTQWGSRLTTKSKCCGAEIRNKFSANLFPVSLIPICFKCGKPCSVEQEKVEKGMIQQFTKKPITIDAIQWTGNNLEELKAWISPDKPAWGNTANPNEVIIHTLEGDHTAKLGDWIIKGVHGEFYPCKPDIFAKTYEDATLPSQELLLTDEEIIAVINESRKNLKTHWLISRKDVRAVTYAQLAKVMAWRGK